MVYDKFEKYLVNPDQVQTDILFSKQDLKRHGVNTKTATDPLHITLGIIILLFVLGLAYHVYNTPNILSIPSIHVPDDNAIITGAEILAALLALSVAVLFFYYESNSKRYIFLDMDFFLKDWILLPLFIIYIFTLTLSLISLAWVIEGAKIISLVFILASILSLPFFVFRCQRIVDRIHVIQKLENDLFHSVEKKDIPSVENRLQEFEFLLINSIEVRDKVLIKRCIDGLHDIAKFYVSTNWEFKNEHLTSHSDESSMYLHTSWFLEEILTALESAFMISLDKNMVNMSDYILRALTSIGTKSLNYEGNHHETELVLKSFKKVMLYSLNRKAWTKRHRYSFRRYFENFIRMPKWKSFAMAMRSFFSEEFIIDLLETYPYEPLNFISYLVDGLRHVHSIQLPNDENALEIARMSYNIYFISQKLEEFDELEGRILAGNKKMREHLSDIIVLCGLVLLFHDKKSEAQKCRKIYIKDKKFDEKGALLRIRNDKTMFISVHDFFREYDNDDVKHFVESKFKKAIREYTKKGGAVDKK